MFNPFFKRKELFMKNKKVLVVFLLITLFTFLCSSSCFANVIYKYNENDIEFADLPLKFDVETHYAIFDGGKYGYSLVYYEGSDFGKFVMDNGVLKSYKKDGSHIVDGSVKLCDYDSSSKNWKASKDWGDCTGGIVGFIYSNVDVFNTDGTVFFHTTPQGIVARQVEEVEMSQVQAEILGILPLILALVVSFLGLRKALKMLATFLRRS